MRVLITGAGGFVGGYMVEHLLEASRYTLHGAVFHPPGQNPRLDALPIEQHHLDLRDRAAVQALLSTVRPAFVIHLAAMADVAASFRDPWATLQNNILAQVNLFLALDALDLRSTRTLVISSAEIYGAAGKDGTPISETQPFLPTSPYSVSKVTQDMLALQYWLSHRLPTIRARPFNHIGPSQKGGFVAADFASQIAAIEAGQRPPAISVGNLSAERDFTDVRDVVRAYRLLLEKGQPGEAYNIARGQGYTIQYLLDTLLSFSDHAITIQQDPALMRPSDVPRRVGDISKLVQATGWQPTIAFEQTIRDILNDWRQRLGVSPR